MWKLAGLSACYCSTTCDHSSHETVHASFYVNYSDCPCLDRCGIACREALFIYLFVCWLVFLGKQKPTRAWHALRWGNFGLASLLERRKQNYALLTVKSSTSCGPSDYYDNWSPSGDTCNWLAVGTIFSEKWREMEAPFRCFSCSVFFAPPSLVERLEQAMKLQAFKNVHCLSKGQQCCYHRLIFWKFISGDRGV